MAAWVPVTSASWFGSALVADLGPYIGPSTPDPPVWMPADAGEVDFYIGVPNLDGIDEDFPDPAFTSQVTDVYRYRVGALEHRGSGYRTIPAGAHLYVAWFDLAFTDPATEMAAPSVAPEALAPSTYVASGTGPSTPPGQWSEWQPPFTVARPVTMSALGAVGGADGYLGSGVAGDFDIAAELATAKFNINAGTGTFPVLATAIVFAGKSEEAHNGDIPTGARDDSTQAVLGLSITSAFYPGSNYGDFDELPPPLAAGTLGTTYGLIPDEVSDDPNTFPFVQYDPDAEAPTFTGWLDGAITVGAVVKQSAIEGGFRYVSGQSGPNEPFTTWETHGYSPTPAINGFQPLDAAPLRVSAADVTGTFATTLLPYSQGDIAADLDLTTTGTSASEPITDSVDLPLSELTAPDISVSVQSRWQGPVDVPANFPDLTMPTLDPAGSVYLDGTEYDYRLYAGPFDLNGTDGITNFPAIANTPTITYLMPAWRYWIPDTATKWHTVGGHWDDLGSVPLKILTPLPGGNTWVDVVDGPA